MVRLAQRSSGSLARCPAHAWYRRTHLAVKALVLVGFQGFTDEGLMLFVALGNRGVLGELRARDESAHHC